MKKLIWTMLLLMFITGCSKGISPGKSIQMSSSNVLHTTVNINSTKNVDSNTSQTSQPSNTAADTKQTLPPSNLLRVHFIDVGQAESILVQAPNGSNLLIDGGDAGSNGLVVNYLKDQNINILDYILVTHPHQDRLGGLASIIEEFDIHNLYMPKVGNQIPSFENVLQAAKEKNLKIQTAKASTLFDLGENVSAVLLAPNSNSYDYLDDYSTVLKVTYGSTSFLFAGDADDKSQQEMLTKGYDLKADVLKIPKHGGFNAILPEFLNSVSPAYAVIFAGRNIEGYPYYSTLNMLAQAGIKIYRTDDAGSIVATSDGFKITFDKEPSPFNQQFLQPNFQP